MRWSFDFYLLANAQEIPESILFILWRYPVNTKHVCTIFQRVSLFIKIFYFNVFFAVLLYYKELNIICIDFKLTTYRWVPHPERNNVSKFIERSLDLKLSLSFDFLFFLPFCWFFLYEVECSMFLLKSFFSKANTTTKQSLNINGGYNSEIPKASSRE